MSARAPRHYRVGHPDIGLIYFVGVGLGETWTTALAVGEGERIKKGYEIGSFHFGGSTHLLVLLDRMYESSILWMNHMQPIYCALSRSPWCVLLRHAHLILIPKSLAFSSSRTTKSRHVWILRLVHSCSAPFILEVPCPMQIARSSTARWIVYRSIPVSVQVASAIENQNTSTLHHTTDYNPKHEQVVLPVYKRSYIRTRVHVLHWI